jgi:hypothetical protein
MNSTSGSQYARGAKRHGKRRNGERSLNRQQRPVTPLPGQGGLPAEAPGPPPAPRRGLGAAGSYD